VNTHSHPPDATAWAASGKRCLRPDRPADEFGGEIPIGHLFASSVATTIGKGDRGPPCPQLALPAVLMANTARLHDRRDSPGRVKAAVMCEEVAARAHAQNGRAGAIGRKHIDPSTTATQRLGQQAATHNVGRSGTTRTKPKHQAPSTKHPTGSTNPGCTRPNQGVHRMKKV